jgi:hypothetical protein
MANVINTTTIHMTDFIQDRPGQFRAIVKVKAGFFTIVDDLGIQANWKTGQQWKRAINVFRGFQKGALQTIEFKAEGSNNWLAVFARNGKTVKLMDRQLFEEIEVGDINQIWSNTNLYDQKQYGMVNAKTWASKAFVQNASTESITAN